MNTGKLYWRRIPGVKSSPESGHEIKPGNRRQRVELQREGVAQPTLFLLSTEVATMVRSALRLDPQPPPQALLPRNHSNPRIRSEPFCILRSCTPIAHLPSLASNADAAMSLPAQMEHYIRPGVVRNHEAIPKQPSNPRVGPKNGPIFRPRFRRRKLANLGHSQSTRALSCACLPSHSKSKSSYWRMRVPMHQT